MAAVWVLQIFDYSSSRIMSMYILYSTLNSLGMYVVTNLKKKINFHLKINSYSVGILSSVQLGKILTISCASCRQIRNNATTTRQIDWINNKSVS